MGVDKSIVVSGRICVGKSEVVHYSSNTFQIPVVSFGSLIRQKAIEEGLPPSRNVMQDLGYKLFTSLGARALILEAIRQAKLDSASSILFDGVRHKDVLQEIRSMSKQVLHIHLNATEEVRFSRYVKRFAAEDITLSDFRRIDMHPIEAGIDDLKHYTDIVIDSSLPLDDVFVKVNGMIKSFLN